jgi:hypothetical protein
MDAEPHSWIPYVHITFKISLYTRRLFGNDSFDFLPVINHLSGTIGACRLGMPRPTVSSADVMFMVKTCPRYFPHYCHRIKLSKAELNRYIYS